MSGEGSKFFGGGGNGGLKIPRLEHGGFEQTTHASEVGAEEPVSSTTRSLMEAAKLADDQSDQEDTQQLPVAAQLVATRDCAGKT